MRTKAIVSAAAAVVALVVGSQWLERGGPRGAAQAAPAMPAMPVPVARVERRTIPIFLDYPARTESIRAIDLRAKISGYVQQQVASDGADVRDGSLLYQIDARDFQAAYDRALAAVDRDVAALDYARSNSGRGDALVKGGWLAQDTGDQRSSTMRQAAASLAMDRAATHTAQLDLDYTRIVAPFAGRLGRNQAPVGTLVSVGTTSLNTLVQLDPIYVTFNPSETDLGEIQRMRAGGAKVTVDVMVPGDHPAPHTGDLTFVDNTIDRTTGTVTTRATVANPDFTLLPGQYVHARVHVGEHRDVLVVPRTAVGSSQLGKYVYTVGPDNHVQLHIVSLGPSDGDVVAVFDGVTEGDQVITGNLQKIGPGAPVQPLPKQNS